MKERVRFARTTDGVDLAWAVSGHGPPLVRAANWLTHLEYDWESAVWRHWTNFFADHFHSLRYDERGCGLSDWDVGDLSSPRWVDDLERVVDTAGFDDRPFVLLGISQGAAAAAVYAARHPQRVSHLILYGGYAVGTYHRGDPEAARQFRAITELIRMGWDADNPAFRQVFTSRFIPEGDSIQLDWFNALCRKSTTGQVGAELMEARGNVDWREWLPRVRVPTLVLHADRDQIVPVSEGRRLARDIPGAEFVQLSSANHVLLEHEPAWRDFTEAVLAFTGHPASAGRPTLVDAAGHALSRRERDLLPLLCEGLSNAEIGYRLGISEKTVRNHLTRLYAKLGVHSRAAVIARAHHAVPTH